MFYITILTSFLFIWKFTTVFTINQSIWKCNSYCCKIEESLTYTSYKKALLLSIKTNKIRLEDVYYHYWSEYQTRNDFWLLIARMLLTPARDYFAHVKTSTLPVKDYKVLTYARHLGKDYPNSVDFLQKWRRGPHPTRMET